jgi:HlyD family secretion protein
MTTAIAHESSFLVTSSGDDGKLVFVKGYLRAGFATLVLLVGGIGGWAATTDLAGAVLAPGTIVVASSVKKIQHPTGGVVGAILVKNGDRVKAGDVLIRLDETVTKANLQSVTKQIDELIGQEARLTAERDDKDRVTFPDDLLARTSEPSVTRILAGEQTLFEKRTSTLRSELNQLGERISGLREEIAGTTAQVAAKSEEIDLIGKELASLEGLEAKQLVTTSRMMSLRREAARLEGERAQLTASIGQSKQKIAEIEVQRLGAESQAKGDIVKELREAEGKIAELSERRTAAEDQLKRVELKSPVNGVVDQLSVFTIGGVINSGEEIMLIVPDDDKLLVEAKISPRDIEQAREHETALVRLTAFDQRTTPTVEGHVVTIAADLSHERETGASYFVARIEIPESELAKLGDHRLLPGMPAEVQIKTNPRTALSYLMKPLADQFAKAFKER